MSRWLRAWGPALRIARREAMRARGRSVLILVMIALPVTAVVGLDVVARTADVTAREGLDRHLGRADALVTYQGDTGPVDQSPTMDGLSSRAVAAGQPERLPQPTAAIIAAELPPGTRVIPLREGDLAVRTDIGVSRPAGVELDLRRPITTGLYDLTSGRYPTRPGEVLVSRRLAQRGFTPGSTLTYGDGQQAKVVGLVSSGAVHATCSAQGCTNDTNLVVGLPGSLPFSTRGGVDSRSWLVDAPGGVSWAQVRALNDHGVYALSRRVVENPPPASEVSPLFANRQSGPSGADISVLAMIVAMALLEVVLLAGPAFAVGVKRMERSLALMAATGAEPPDIRKVVLASGVVLGVAAGVAGTVMGVAGAWLSLPFVQSFSSERFGPFEVVPRDLLVIAACGVVSAIAAALVPAVMASRQDVVAVLAGRRGQTRRPVWSPVLGSVLLGLGIAGAVTGARKPSGGEFLIAGAAVAAVLGMVLLIPLAVTQLGRFARPLPLPLRFAVRDAARQRARTAPAVAAVAAVVAGVVALGVGGTSDAAERKATYTPVAPLGAGVLTWYSPPEAKAQAGGWDAMAAAVSRQLPDATVQRMQGVPDSIGPHVSKGTAEAPVTALPRAERSLVVGADDPSSTEQGVSFSSNYGASLLVGPQTLAASGVRLSAGNRARARTVLARGGIVLFGYTSSARIATEVVRLQQLPTGGDDRVRDVGRWTLPATTVQVAGSVLPARGVISAAAARTAGVPVETTSLLVTGTALSQGAEDRVDEAVAQIDPDAGLSVERGYHDNSIAVALLILGVAGGALVLGGTLTATFLALSDARPDFATMGAVGAAPGTRRLVASSYAWTVGAVGAVLGAAVGFVPGIAVTYPLTSTSWMAPGSTDSSGAAIPDHFLDVPWALIGSLVIGLPLFAALVVGLATRPRLPMVSRLT